MRQIVLNRLFTLLYHQFSWTYDLVASIVSIGAWKSWVYSTLPYIKGPRVLEIGFGPGHLQQACKQKGISIFGIDKSVQMTHIAHRRILRSGFQPSLVLGDAQTLPFANNSFQQAVMTFPSNFLYAPTFFAEIHRILVNDGTAIIVPVAWITGRGLLARAVGWVNRITGQAPSWDESTLEMFTSPFFVTRWEMVDLQTSKVLLIQLKKVIDR